MVIFHIIFQKKRNSDDISDNILWLNMLSSVRLTSLNEQQNPVHLQTCLWERLDIKFGERKN
jgi:hypothetical protein